MHLRASLTNGKPILLKEWLSPESPDPSSPDSLASTCPLCPILLHFPQIPQIFTLSIYTFNMKFDKKESPQDLEPSGVIQRSPSQCSEDGESSPHIEDAVFGEVSEGGPNYRNVSQSGEYQNGRH